MPTSLEEPRTPGAPIVKGRAIGQTFVGALAGQHQRDMWKDGKPAVKDDGKVRQEMVLTLVTMPGTTTPAGLAGVEAIPEPGDKVRLIVSGMLFHDWIEAKRDHGQLETGDVVTWTTEYAQAYAVTAGVAKPSGGRITAQADVDAIPRGTSVGIYGTLTLRKPTPAEVKWVELADAAHFEQRTRTPIAEPVTDDEEPF